jgi:hypothetical protein
MTVRTQFVSATFLRNFCHTSIEAAVFRIFSTLGCCALSNGLTAHPRIQRVYKR